MLDAIFVFLILFIVIAIILVISRRQWLIYIGSAIQHNMKIYAINELLMSEYLNLYALDNFDSYATSNDHLMQHKILEFTFLIDDQHKLSWYLDKNTNTIVDDRVLINGNNSYWFAYMYQSQIIDISLQNYTLWVLKQNL